MEEIDLAEFLRLISDTGIEIISNKLKGNSASACRIVKYKGPEKIEKVIKVKIYGDIKKR